MAPDDTSRAGSRGKGRLKQTSEDSDMADHGAAFIRSLTRSSRKRKIEDVTDDESGFSIEDMEPNVAVASPARHNGLNTNLREIYNAEDAFRDLMRRALLPEPGQGPLPSLRDIALAGGFRLNVGTMCSGTDAPIFALKMLQNEFYAMTGMELFRYKQQYAVEIDPYKQAYLRRNTDADVFRDVRDFAQPNIGEAKLLTALGSRKSISYDKWQMLIVGTSCVSFSNLNNAKQKDYGGPAAGDFHRYLQKIWETKEDPGQQPHKRKISTLLGQIVQNLTLSESDATFFPVLTFIQNNQPAIVIFENVLDAPWEDLETIFMPAVGYKAAFMSCDTKDYYMPQTRQRKYLVAFSNEAFGSNMTGDMAKDAMSYLKYFQRRASVDVEKFLYHNTDPATQVDIQQLEHEKANKTTRESSWQFSQQRHENVRQTEGLGRSHPFSGLKPTGETRFYDRANQTIMARQPDRVKDVADISLLRGLTASPSYDSRFKVKIHDFSQNVDRNLGTNPFGISGCLTPSGMAFISNQSRFVTGREYLQLQGLPVQSLSLSRETTDQLKNLAGNAMTTTVVGAIFLSAIMAMHKHNGPAMRHGFPHISDLDETFKGPLSSLPRFRLVPTDHEQDLSFDPSGYVNATTGEILALTKRIRPYCFCTGTAMYSSAILWKCQTCDTIRCGNCKGNPKHDYAKLDLVPEAFGQEAAKLMLMKHFPQVLCGMFPSNVARACLSKLRGCWCNESDHIVVTSLLCNAVFYFDGVHLSETVSICYGSQPGFKVKIMIDAESITWYLFIDPHSDVAEMLAPTLVEASRPDQAFDRHSREYFPSPERVRDFLLRGRPVSRAQIADEDLPSLPMHQQWLPWNFFQPSRMVNGSQVYNQRVLVTKEEKSLTIDRLPEEDEDQCVTDRLAEGICESLYGTWEQKPNCDVAENSLYVQHQNNGEDLFLFKDPSRIGPAELDAFVLSKNPRLMQWHEHREVLLSFVPMAEPSRQIHKLPRGTYVMLITMDGFWQSDT
ncbi:hypothetical protein PFICI_06599 [Pestalotiopsis fici W106-1]|uniref:Uncharacterized protein n=1 Tax=Pestalotiopsis fici (strain W106-1 / CGMCC3.15140) TaxID=1229662 RepID=W3X860_PESFW|nr:uncharacterized protein PFICI_06599 [Pestalotiopsis fici W106-1]ETS81597.1 hypothetical protein PFICI_06599 [Pestalotiopsis fici W106-1]